VIDGVEGVGGGNGLLPALVSTAGMDLSESCTDIREDSGADKLKRESTESPYLVMPNMFLM
jgi:hypothetical protein